MRLLIIGDDSSDDPRRSERKRLQRVAKQLGIDHMVDFLGPVAQSELIYYYNAADVLVMPSYSESFGLVGLEAQACGCPVIAPRVGGLADIVRHGVNGYLVESNSPQEYSGHLAEVLRAPRLREEMGVKAALLAQRYPWSATAERLLDVVCDQLDRVRAKRICAGQD